MVASSDGSGRRGRRQRSELRAARSVRTLLTGPPPRNALAPVALLSEDQVETIHEASLELLQEIGVELMGSAARDAFRAAGAHIDDETGLARIPREVVAHALTTTPERFTVTPRNPARRLDVGGSEIAFGLVAGPPTVHDRVRGRRAGNLDDYVTLVKLAQCFDVVHFVGNQPTSPQELPATTRHLDTYLANLTYTDRVFHLSAIGRQRALDGIEMTAISRGLTLERFVDTRPC